MGTDNAMRSRLLDVAERLVQAHGYDGFSYADIADAIGIRKASIHHHFATKGDLSLALVERSRLACREAFAAIEAASDDPARRLVDYTRIFEATLADDGRMCLCGMLAASHATIPAPVREALGRAIADHEDWLTSILKAGQADRSFRTDVSPRRQAQALFSGLEGAILIARVVGAGRRFRAVAASLISGVLSEPVGDP